MPFTIVRDDITRLKVDAVVNAANTGLRRGGGVCGAIFKAAGEDALASACGKLAPIKTGEAVLTQGFKLPAKYVIHTAGPVYRGGKRGEEELLRACYINSLELAVKNHCESIAFPLISSGIYGYPKSAALRIATKAIRDFISQHDIDVMLVVFDKKAFAVSKELLGAVKSYVDEHYIEQHTESRSRPLKAERQFFPYDSDYTQTVPCMAEPCMESLAAPLLDDLVGSLDEPFSAMLLRLIDATGRKDAETYRRANIDRRLFSKIRSNADYVPSKPTVLAFAIALELDLDQTRDLLERAGFALSHSRKFDVIVEYFIQNRRYNIFEINEVLFRYDQQLLGG